MKAPKNLIASKLQSHGVTGWVYDGVDGKQMAYWICETDGISHEHVHEFDEYFTVIQGTYTLIINGQRIAICKGDEYFIPKMCFMQVSSKKGQEPFTALAANALIAYNTGFHPALDEK
jgi:mannose-6-phosphate isomerase-like protein (cupin superfamily)